MKTSRKFCEKFRKNYGRRRLLGGAVSSWAELWERFTDSNARAATRLRSLARGTDEPGEEAKALLRLMCPDHADLTVGEDTEARRVRAAPRHAQSIAHQRTLSVSQHIMHTARSCAL